METKIQVRFPEDVLGEMRKLAGQHTRSFNGEVIWALRQYVKAERQKDMQNMRQASRDQIVAAIHVLWERDWLVSLEAIQDMLVQGSHTVASLAEIKPIAEELQPQRDAWMAQFDYDVLVERRKLYPQPR